MELFKLLGTVAINNTGAKAAIDETSDGAEKLGSKMSQTFTNIGNAAVKVGKVMAAGLAVGTTAVIALGKEALEGYADYEQLVGGVETLFGTGGQSIKEYAESVGKSVDDVKDEYDALMRAQNTVLKNAKGAYKSAGMSMNEYMETVTGFSASLIQSLDGDTEAAAKKAHQAITDMSDNANKMGTSMTLIQNAYGGFAKGNYTMLDNLKLGYGGTQEEMKRLIQEASKMKDVQEELGVTVDANSTSFGNIVDAISVVQKSMGIMGTTSKEASETISGSISSMKSAWSNFVAGFANEDADMGLLLGNLVESVDTVWANIKPRISTFFSNLGGVISEYAPKLIAGFTTELVASLPALLTSAVSMVKTVATTVATTLPEALHAVLPQSVKDFLDEFHDYVCDTVVFGLEAVWESVKNLASAFKPLIDAVKGFLAPLQDVSVQQEINRDIVYFLEEKLYKLADVINMVADVLNGLFTFIIEHKALVESVAVVLGSFATAFVVVTKAVQTFKTVMSVAKTAITAVKGAIALLTSPIGIAVVAIGAIVAAGVLLYKNWDVVKEKAIAFGQKIVDVWNEVKEPFENIFDSVEKIAESAKGLWSTITEAYESHIKPTIDAFVGMIKELWIQNQDKLTLIKELYTAFAELIFEKVEKIVGKIENFAEKVKFVAEKIAEAISEKVEKIVLFIQEYVIPYIMMLVNVIQENVEHIKTYIQAGIDFIATIIEFFINLFQGNWSAMWESIQNVLTAGVEFIKKGFQLLISIVKSLLIGWIEFILDKVFGLKVDLEQKFTEIKDNIVEKWNNIKDSVSETVTNLKENVSQTFTDLKEALKSPINGIIGMVNKVIDALNSLSWSFPDWIPEFGGKSFGFNLKRIAYLAEGGILTSPTLLQYNPYAGTATVAGEAGAEAVIPIEKLKVYIAEEMAAQNYGVVNALQSILNAILALDENMGGNLRDALAGTSFAVNNREFARLVKAVN